MRFIPVRAAARLTYSRSHWSLAEFQRLPLAFLSRRRSPSRLAEPQVKPRDKILTARFAVISTKNAVWKSQFQTAFRYQTGTETALFNVRELLFKELLQAIAGDVLLDNLAVFADEKHARTPVETVVRT